MNAKDLYDELAGHAWKLAAKSMLDIEDIQQELYLICMEVAEGRSSYTPIIGGVNEYIMGRLWGLVHRWIRSYCLDDFLADLAKKYDYANDSQLGEYVTPPGLHVPSVEEVLEQRELAGHQDVIDVEETRQLRKFLKDQPTLAILLQTGHWSYRTAAVFCGTNYPWIQRYVQKFAKRDLAKSH